MRVVTSARDQLNRRALAHFLATRMAEFCEQEPARSFLIHVDGPWGSGKSTLLDYLAAALKESTNPAFRVRHVRRVAPFPALPAVVGAAHLDPPGGPRRADPAPAGVVLVPQTWSDTGRVVSALTAALAVIWAGGMVLGRVLLWHSARGARLHQQAGVNPMEEVSRHFGWLLERAGGRTVIFVDDLDRCPEGYVVEFLESIQTLVRPAAERRNGTHAALFVVAADGRWLRESYERTYAAFSGCVGEPGATIGYLFLDKIFQLSLTLPPLSDQLRSRFLSHLLHEQPDTTEDLMSAVRKANAEIEAGGSDEQKIIATLQALPPAARVLVA